ncbi:hypothetical protein KCP73_07435 [Salmonella enterica subsp. enterica]|nr:hypothetical protein KCP73_07435 [Salmonella enterica subsp. enterica]
MASAAPRDANRKPSSHRIPTKMMRPGSIVSPAQPPARQYSTNNNSMFLTGYERSPAPQTYPQRTPPL